MMETGSRADRIAARIQGKYATPAQQLPTGSRLASVRAAAREYGVSKNTVVEAYDRLVATGHIEARRGSGFYVARPVRHPASAPPPHFTEAIDLVSRLRRAARPALRGPRRGRPATGKLDGDLGARAVPASRQPPGRGGGRFRVRPPARLSATARDHRPDADRTRHRCRRRAGTADLRRQPCPRSASPLRDPGETVLVETPGYYPLFGKLRLHRAAMAGVPRGHDGPDPAALEAAIQRHRPRLMFVQPLGHNPTGTSMSLAAMHRLLRIAERHDLILIEDDPFADLIPHVTPRLAALDGLQRVIYLGTFSKTLSAGLRSGYIAAGEGLIDSLTDIKMLTGGHQLGGRGADDPRHDPARSLPPAPGPAPRAGGPGRCPGHHRAGGHRHPRHRPARRRLLPVVSATRGHGRRGPGPAGLRGGYLPRPGHAVPTARRPGTTGAPHQYLLCHRCPPARLPAPGGHPTAQRRR
ncbi:MAG: PLP-dependent aminotransferase family protein [Arhodomonas sp.]|nr:PLP-dependent aminotransferase family protein [Arhodomonas sp.]